MARILCTRDLNSDQNHLSFIEAYLSCCLIPLDKCPGVRPSVLVKSLDGSLESPSSPSSSLISSRVLVRSSCLKVYHLDVRQRPTQCRRFLKKKGLTPFCLWMPQMPSTRLTDKCCSTTSATSVLPWPIMSGTVMVHLRDCLSWAAKEFHPP